MRHFVHKLKVLTSKKELILPVLLVLQQNFLLDRMLGVSELESLILITLFISY